MAGMFGLLISGRLVDTSFREVDQTHCVIDIQNADAVNHIVVFLTGTQPFPDGTGGSVYFCWPDGNGAPNWQLLGVLSNEKPSAIFKISKLKTSDENQNMAQRFGQLHMPHVAQVGVSIEPIVNLNGLTPAAQTEASNAATFVEFSQKMVENLFNYLSSFGISAAELRDRPNESYVPFSAVQQWYTNFERRLQQNPYFWRS